MTWTCFSGSRLLHATRDRGCCKTLTRPTLQGDDGAVTMTHDRCDWRFLNIRLRRSLSLCARSFVLVDGSFIHSLFIKLETEAASSAWQSSQWYAVQSVGGPPFSITIIATRLATTTAGPSAWLIHGALIVVRPSVLTDLFDADNVQSIRHRPPRQCTVKRDNRVDAQHQLAIGYSNGSTAPSATIQSLLSSPPSLLRALFWSVTTSEDISNNSCTDQSP